MKKQDMVNFTLQQSYADERRLRRWDFAFASRAEQASEPVLINFRKIGSMDLLNLHSLSIRHKRGGKLRSAWRTKWP